jgi:integrase
MYGNGSVYSRPESKFLWIDYWVDGKHYRESSGTTDQKEARRLLDRRIAEKMSHQVGLSVFIGPQNTPLNHLLDLLLEDYRVRGRKSLPETSYRLAAIRVHLGECTVGEITTAKLRWYVARRMDEGRKNATINRELAAIRRAMYLRKAEYSVREIPEFPMLPEHNVRRGFFELPDAERVIGYLPDYLQDLARFAYRSGWRRGDVTSLTWEQVDIAEKVVMVEHTKEDRPRVLALEGELWAIIERRLAEKDGPYIFHRYGQRIQTFRKAWATACAAAGMSGRRFHDFRRSTVRNLTRAGVPDKIAMDMTGHKTRSIFDRYNITSTSDLREAARKMEQYLAEPPQEPPQLNGHVMQVIEK